MEKLVLSCIDGSRREFPLSDISYVETGTALYVLGDMLCEEHGVSDSEPVLCIHFLTNFNRDRMFFVKSEGYVVTFE